MTRCDYCKQPITTPHVRLEGVARSDDPELNWVWGPFPVHIDGCRPRWRTPYDDEVGAGFVLVWEDVPNLDRPRR